MFARAARFPGETTARRVAAAHCARNAEHRRDGVAIAGSEPSIENITVLFSFDRERQPFANERSGGRPAREENIMMCLLGVFCCARACVTLLAFPSAQCTPVCCAPDGAYLWLRRLSESSRGEGRKRGGWGKEGGGRASRAAWMARARDAATGVARVKTTWLLRWCRQFGRRGAASASDSLPLFRIR